MRILPAIDSIFAATFLAMTFVAGGAPTTGDAPTEFPYTVHFEVGDTELAPGDAITITAVHGTRDIITTNETYCVEGTYTLASKNEARLALFATINKDHATPTDPRQCMQATKGTGTFRLIKTMEDEGYLHVGFYDVESWNGLRGVYFGTGAWVYKNRISSRFHEISQPRNASTGPNVAERERFGSPVPPPSGTVAERLSPAAKSRPASEDTYTITSVIQVLNPADPAVMNDDFQDARVLLRDKDSVTVEITYYPLYQQVVGENPNWRRDDAKMTEYLQPTPTENWDEKMREDLIKELREAGIDPESLTDKQLVEQVSKWAVRGSHTINAFAVWTLYYPNGVPTVYPPLREAFDREKPDSSWTEQRMFEREALGRQMFYNKTHGSCTSSSIYLATILRALGIPTRIITCIPPFDPNDDAQAKMFYDNVHNNKVRETVRSALEGEHGFDSHNFNEVYVGHHWVRLNYSTLGQPILDAHCFGLLGHVFTCSDFSKAPMAQTWGMRYFKYHNAQPQLSSENPYRLISIHDHFGANARLDNPPVPELQTVTIIGLYPPGSPKIPGWVAKGLAPYKSRMDFLIAAKEWIEGDFHQMRTFEKRTGHEFVLSTPQHPDVKASLSGDKYSDGHGTFQAYGVQILPEDKDKLASGVPYSIRPINVSETYRWAVAPDTTLTFNDGNPAEPARAARPQTSGGPNAAILEYLGEPVPPPADMDAAYSAKGLKDAVELAAKNAGIAIKRIEIDESEFPFLVAIGCEGGDWEKLKAQLRKLDAYEYSGGFTSDTINVINLVPTRAFPNGSFERISHRLMLREHIFCNKNRSPGITQ